MENSLAPQDLHTVIGTSGFDLNGHGTKMAGIGLFGDLDPLLSGTQTVALRHRLESVRILPQASEPQHDPLAYGDVTARQCPCRDRSPQVPRVQRKRPSKNVQTLLDHIGTSGDPIFWG